MNEDLNGDLLPKLILLERKEDYPGDVAEIIDLEKLGNNNLLMVVLTKDPRIEVGDEIVATYTATDTGQPADVVENVRDKVKEDPFTGKLPCFLEVARNNVFADSKVTATYEVHRSGVGLAGRSNTATAVVTGTAPIELLPPALIPPTVPIDVLANPTGVKLQLKDFAAQNGDKAQFVHVNAPDGAPALPAVEFVDGFAQILLSAAFLVAWHGEAIEFRWDLIRNGVPAGESPAATFDVMKIADGDPRLPTPDIAGNTGDVLNTTELSPEARILAARWPLFEPGQPIWVTCAGFDKNGNAVKDVRSGEFNESANGLSVEAPIEWLKALKHGTEQTTIVKVNLDGVAGAAKAAVLPSRIYTVKALHPFTIETVPMELNGLNINADFLALTGTPAPGTTQTRLPTSGDGNYAYFSSATDVATVDSNGLVSGCKNGSAIITVRENSTQREVSFPVRVQNVTRLVMTPTHTYSIGAAINWMNSIGGSPVSNAAIDVLRVKFRPLVSSAGGWLCRSDGCGAGHYLSVVTNNPNTWTISCFTGNNSQAHGWCLLPG